MSLFTLQEARSASIPLTRPEADALNQLGKEMARRAPDPGEGTFPAEPSVLRCNPSPSGDTYIVDVDNVVGVIRIGEKQIVIQPKIPVSHLLYILSRAQVLPRLRAEAVSIPDLSDLSQLLPAWYVMLLEELLRHGLLHDYRTLSGSLETVRGTLHPIRTADHYYVGRVLFDCSYDEFDDDSSLNRLLKGAAIVIACNPTVSDTTRTRARRCLYYFDSVSAWSLEDLKVSVDRRSAYYADAILLARAILRCEYRSIGAGAARGFCFLLPTALAVEDGIRRILAESLKDMCVVEKRGFQLVGTSVSIYPDVRFDHLACVADVKYKLYGGWPRADAYQAVAYASALRCTNAALLSFTEAEERLPDLPFGDIVVSNITWCVDPQTNPESASERFVTSCRDWLKKTTATA